MDLSNNNTEDNNPEDDNREGSNRTGPSMSRLPLLIIAGIAVAAGVFAGTRSSEPGNTSASQTEQALQGVQAELISSTVFPDDFKTVPPFALVHGDHQALTEADLANKWTVLFFGFTHCPDICPTTLNEMNGVVTELSEQGFSVPQALFITVDPVRDTVEKMTEYVGYFNPSFIGASGDLADITALTSKLGVVASYTASTDGSDNYTVDHTASMLLIDPQLRVRAKLNPPHKRDNIVADLKTLITHYN